MFELSFPTITSWLQRRGTRWRVSTWWPSDRRGAMQRSLLHLLSVAHRERLDVATLVANLAEEHRGGYRRRLRRLGRRLSDGTSLVDALEQTPDALSDESVLAIRFASQTGTLAPTYQHLLQPNTIIAGVARIHFRQTIAYSIVTLLILILSISFLATFIVPTLSTIRTEFGMDVSSSTSRSFDFFVSVCELVANYAPLWIVLIVGACWLIWSAPSRRFFRRMYATRWMRGAAEIRTSEVLDFLSLAIEAGRPLPAAISTLARYHFDTPMRHKLLYARNEIEQGTDVWQSLADAQILSSNESQTLANSTSKQSRVWAMRRLADWKQEQVSQRADSIAGIAQPIVTLILASVVLLVASAVIGFLSELIQTLA